MRPAYLALHETGALSGRIEKALGMLARCELCPRECRVDRSAGERGLCRTGRLARVAAHHLHFGEEDPLVGETGSGTIFFAGCNLLCVFCQNFEISHRAEGFPEIGPEALAAMMLDLQERGAVNINLVTPSHVTPQILEALPYAVEGGLRLPLVYNCGGYESVETLRLLDGFVDLYMPDVKFWDPEVARRYLRAPDYPERAREAVLEMRRQVGDLVLDARGVAERGLLVRHLVMPGGLAGSARWLRFLAEEVSKETYVNVMGQYHPCGLAGEFPEIDRVVTSGELRQATEAAVEAGLDRLDEPSGAGVARLLRRLLSE